MTSSSLELLRQWLYPFGLVSSVFFGLRFLVQWWKSERAGQSIVPQSFWHLSFYGNICLMIHSLIQVQFPLCFLQSQHAVFSWRNLNLTSKKPVSFPLVIFLLFLSGALITTLFISSQLITGETISWMRSPSIPVSNWAHGAGTIGIMLFSFRFWLQWWQAEQKKETCLSPTFWWISLAGSLSTFFYFLALFDWINFIGPVLSLIPYSRNLALFYKKRFKPVDIVIISGETSGDQLGQKIVSALQKKHPSLSFAGIAGNAMREKGVHAWFNMESFQVMGIVDVIKKFPFLVYALYKTVRLICKANPKVIICIDQPSFSLAIAKRLRKKNISGKIVQVVAPTVWAYKPERATLFSKYFDLLLPLFRFETQFFEDKLPTTWIGHPTLRTIQPSTQKQKEVLSLFPGSRPGEVYRNLPLQLETAAQIRKNHPNLPIAISIADSLSKSTKKTIESLASAHLQKNFELVNFADRFELMNRSKAAIVKLGTTTLELALHKVPSVCCYKVHPFTHWWAKRFLKLRPRLFALPNILAGEKIFPECIYPPVSAKDLQNEIEPYICGTKSLPLSFFPTLMDQIDPGEKSESLVAQAISTIL